MHRRRVAFALAALSAASAGGPALAAGFALKEQSGTAQGNAFAGATAGADDISYMFFNPAALGMMSGDHQLVATGSLILAHMELQSASGTTGAGTPIGGSVPRHNIAEFAAVPALYGGLRLGEQWVAGLGINAPFGLGTEYPDGWVGRYHAVDSSVKVIGVTPTLAYRPLPGLAFGAGLQASHADASLSNAIDFGTIGAGLGIPGSLPGRQDGFARVDGDDWQLGYTLGALAEPISGTRIGIGYRSKVEHRLKGDADFSTAASPTGRAIEAATGAFADTGVGARIELPASASIGIQQRITDRVDVMAEAAWTNWSRFDELRLTFDNPAQPDSVTEYKWKDSWFLALGATWRPRDDLTLRAGVAHDQTPVDEAHTTPRIPDGDRTWLSLGVGWMPLPWLSLDAAVTHIFVEDAEVRLEASEPGNATRGDLDADYDNSIDLVTISAKLRF
ncbi:MAG TPA: TonB-dependent receptor [Geminicoccaceae bacterium]|nr:TonB-dependent receptor [Geminicoccus sp.]HMU51965.1 TonB-dependent receptor [Geminicoccaceae bacterium]